jgi:hypothetical protein
MFNGTPAPHKKINIGKCNYTRDHRLTTKNIIVFPDFRNIENFERLQTRPEEHLHSFFVFSG